MCRRTPRSSLKTNLLFVAHNFMKFYIAYGFNKLGSQVYDHFQGEKNHIRIWGESLLHSKTLAAVRSKDYELEDKGKE